MTTTYTPQEILALPMEENDGAAENIGQYFASLLHTLWIEGEGFSGKRPFGNSGWESDVEKALIRANAVEGRIDEDGYIETVDSNAAESIILDTIRFLYKADWKTLTEWKEPEDWYVLLLDRNSLGNPILTDTFAIGFTEKAAKAKADHQNIGNNSGLWVAVQMPK